MNVLHMYIYIRMQNSCVSGAQRGKKRASDPLELELHIVVSHHEGSGNQSGVPGGATVL